MEQLNQECVAVTVELKNTEKRRRSKYKKIDVINTAKSCKSLAQFTRMHSGMIKAAVANGYMDEVRLVLGVRPKVQNGYWLIKENVAREAANYETKSEFKKHRQSAYNGMVKLGLSDELFPNGKKSNGYWTKDRVIEVCKNFKSVSEFAASEPTAYCKAVTIGECIEIMDCMERARNRPGYWTKSRLQNEANKHHTITSFILNSKGAHAAAVAMGIIDEITQHMESGYKSTNCNYIWKVAGFDGLYKIGVSNIEFYQSRISAVCRAHNFSCEWSLAFKTKQPNRLEKALLKLGSIPCIEKKDGYTEFRVLDQNQLNKALEIMKNAKLN